MRGLGTHNEFLDHRKKAAGQRSFFKFPNSEDLKAVGQTLDHTAVEEMNDKTFIFIDLLASVCADSEIGIFSGPNRVHLDSTGLEDPPDLCGQSRKLVECEIHAIEHMRVTCVEDRIWKWEWFQNVVLHGSHVLG